MGKKWWGKGNAGFKFYSDVFLFKGDLNQGKVFIFLKFG